MTHCWSSALPTDAIDWDSVAVAADDCDTVISYGGDDVAMFSTAGVLRADAPIAPQLSGMLDAFGGAIVLTPDGKYGIRADVARASVFTISDDDILGLEEFPHDTDADARFSAIKARFFDAEADGRQTTTPVLEALDDADVTRETAIELPFVPYSHSAQIRAWRHLWAAREGTAFAIRLRDFGLFLDPADVVTIESETFPWLDGEYAVTQVDLANVGCVVALRKVAANAYIAPAEYLI
jgi:hypothetical protein